MSADGFDDAVIGVYGNNWNNCEPVLAYSQKKCIEILMKDMSYTEAMEYFEFNTIGAYMGVKNPNIY